jgi:hypothetical protein
MKGLGRAIWLAMAVALALLGPPVRGEVATAAETVLRVDFSNPGLSPAHWTLTLRPDGSGHFHSDGGNGEVAQGGSAGLGDTPKEDTPKINAPKIDAPPLDRDIRVSEGFAGRVFLTGRRQKLFGPQCESHLKVAFQGWKKLQFSGPDGEWGCEFNYSKDKEVQALGESLVAVAGTIIEGARLELLLQHDRLGLDRETEFLVEAAADGSIKQVCAIRGILERLADDPEVLERVRKRARTLLADAGNEIGNEIGNEAGNRDK